MPLWNRASASSLAGASGPAPADPSATTSERLSPEARRLLATVVAAPAFSARSVYSHSLCIRTAVVRPFASERDSTLKDDMFGLVTVTVAPSIGAPPAPVTVTRIRAPPPPRRAEASTIEPNAAASRILIDIRTNSIPRPYNRENTENLMKIARGLLGFVLAGATVAAASVDREKLGPLHRSGRAFQAALEAGTSDGERSELASKLELEAVAVEHRLDSPEEQLIYDLYSTAAAEYQAARRRFDSHRSREKLEAELAVVKEYLRRADEAYE